MMVYQKIIETYGPAAVILIRLMVGGVFLAEGIQKFLFPNEVGAGRFAKIGIPSPDVMASFVGVVEIVCIIGHQDLGKCDAAQEIRLDFYYTLLRRANRQSTIDNRQ